MLDPKDKMVEDITSVPKGLRAYWKGKLKKNYAGEMVSDGAQRGYGAATEKQHT